jgi:hypothetical protein
MGELLIADLFLVLAALFFLAFLDSSKADATGGWAVSRSISMGELFECVLWSYTEPESFCACRAGEVRGLK